MDLQDIFVDQINPDLVSVYIGRVISLDDNFQDNGYLYVDLVNVDSKDLEEGQKTATRATATFALRNCYNSWERPPEIKSKTQFMGSMNMTTSGDFHLRNYCFDAQTLAWFTTVSTALNAIGIVNVPPVLVGLDITPIPGQAVSVNVAQAATDVVNEAIDDSLRDIEPETNTKKSNAYSVNVEQPSLVKVKRILQNKINKKSLLRNTQYDNSDNPNVIIANVIYEIVSPIDSILISAFQPYFQFTECISLLFQIYESNLNDIEEITWPITQFTNLTDSTTNESPNQITQEALKNVLGSKIDAFKTSINNYLPTLNVNDIVTESLYNPLAYIYQTISDKIDSIVSPIKSKIVEIITTFIKPVLADIVGFISMSIQPAISSLPSFIQLIVQKALKKLLQLLLGKPIKNLLEKVIEPIKELIDDAVSSMKTKIIEVFEDALRLIVYPIIKSIQTTIMEMIPIFDMQSLVEKLREIADINSGITFPDIYIGIDPLHPYKKFFDINWSDDYEIACLLKTLIDDTPLKELELSTVDITTVVEEIRNNNKEKDPSVFVETTSTNTNFDNTIYLRKFTSKDEFMPYFTAMYPPAMKEASLTDGMFKDYGNGKKKPDVWITNGVHYVTTDTDEKYIVAIEDDESVKVIYPEDGEIGNVSLEKDRIYCTEEIPHIVDYDSEDDLTEGMDLVPQINYTTSGISPILFEIQKVNDKGELLYLAKEKNPENPDEYIIVEKTYDEIVVKYLQPKIYLSDIDSKLKGFIIGEDPNNLLQKINDHVSANPSSDEVTWLNNQNDGITKQELYIYITDKSTYNKTTEGIFISRKEWDTTEPQEEVSKRITDLGNIFYKNILRETDPDDSTKERLIISIYNYNSSLIPPIVDFENKIKYEFIFRRDKSEVGVEPNLYDSNDIEIKYYMLSSTGVWFLADDPDQGFSIPVFTFSEIKSEISPDNLYVYMSQENTYIESIVAENFSNPEKTNDTLLTMLVSSVRAIGQDGVFNADILFGSVVKKVMSVFSPIADSMDKISNTVDSALEVLDSLKEVDSMIGTIKELGDKIETVANTAKPAMEAVAKAASVSAIQSCSMSQAATGKDFGFNSGDNYDLSTTTDLRSQLPYCKQLRREHLIEPNCKVLVLAVGAGKQNLYAVDILN